ncbi:MAG: molybdopterin cofactor-binding domain-containing protein [Planctomycetota bacterium]
MGGGFGAKLTPGVEATVCAQLSKELGRPVHLFVDRRACALATGNRPASLQLLTAKATADGKLTDFTSKTRGFPGYNGSGGVRGSQGYYVRTRDRGDHRDMRANTGSARAFRAPGCPQGYFASEGLIDEMAYRVGQDPLAFRLANLQNEVHKEQLRVAAEAIGYEQGRNRAPGVAEPGTTRLRGIGMAISSWFQSGQPRNAVLCRIHPDGRVEVRNGAQDIGTGTRTVLALVTAEELGVPVDRIEVVLGHTSDPPGPGSGGSTTTPSLAPTARKAAFLAGRELLRTLREAIGKDAGEPALEGGQVVWPDGRKLAWTEACKHLRQAPVEAQASGWERWRGYANNVHGAQMADLSVDLRTGAIELHKIVAVQDCGTVVDKLTAESQVIGGVIQGIGFAMYEERLTDTNLGRVLNTDFEHYRIPGVLEIPEIVAILPRANNGHNCVGTMGLGEPPTIPTSAAIANAVRNATGVRPLRLPLTPARVHEGLVRMKIGRNA